MNRRTGIALLFAALLCLGGAEDEKEPLTVELDVKEAPHLKAWGEQSRQLILEWHPRIVNLLPTKGFDPPRRVVLRIRKSDKGVAATAGRRISVMSHWVDKHPDDVGVVIHELVHVIQSYPRGNEGWLVEGVADYVRWAIYEGKPQEWFPRPRKVKGYERGYRVAAGFLLWLETDAAPGIVKKLNTAMRRGAYSPEIFKKETGKSLDELWAEYVGLE